MVQSKKVRERQLVLAKRKIQKHVCQVLNEQRHGLKANAAISIYLEYYNIETPLHKDEWIRLEFKNKESPLSKTKLIKRVKSKTTKKEVGFYESESWQLLRKRILRLYGCTCMKCNISNTEMHVDHIKPRSKYPHLELDENNLQVLCRDCNIEKSNKNEIDYRPISRKNDDPKMDDSYFQIVTVKKKGIQI